MSGDGVDTFEAEVTRSWQKALLETETREALRAEEAVASAAALTTTAEAAAPSKTQTTYIVPLATFAVVLVLLYACKPQIVETSEGRKPFEVPRYNHVVVWVLAVLCGALVYVCTTSAE